jgi:hypothetical protein
MKWEVIAYADPEMGLKKKNAFVWADSREEAERKAWQMFPEYHEVGVYKV